MFLVDSFPGVVARLTATKTVTPPSQTESGVCGRVQWYFEPLITYSCGGSRSVSLRSLLILMEPSCAGRMVTQMGQLCMPSA